MYLNQLVQLCFKVSGVFLVLVCYMVLTNAARKKQNRFYVMTFANTLLLTFRKYKCNKFSANVVGR